MEICDAAAPGKASKKKKKGGAKSNTKPFNINIQ